ncbi:SDR family NAD(P)-dependent oxidoreductase [Streptomyces sp. NPDC059568]|uniref:SDR family NAD(P)-dependent oxidoreductase n=1 Tax=Streptomyces sp. NPDC059568 TaxID=3346868 RepID=UPI003683D413
MAQDSLITSSQKVAIVTGASGGGIGAAVVEAYRGLGYRVTATGRSIPSSDDREVLALAGDATAPGTAARLVEAMMRRFGRVDTLVNCAGIFVLQRRSPHSPRAGWGARCPGRRAAAERPHLTMSSSRSPSTAAE